MKRIISLVMVMLALLFVQTASSEDGSVICSTQEELGAALADESVHTISLSNSIEISGYLNAEVSRPVTVDMGPYGISFGGQFSGLSVSGPVLFTGDGDTAPLFTMGYRQYCTLYGGTIEATADQAVALLFTSSGKMVYSPLSVYANGADSIAVKSLEDISLSFVTIEANGPGGIGVQADGAVSVALAEITAGGQALVGSDAFICSSLVAANGLTHDSLPLRAAIVDTCPGAWHYSIDEAITLPDSIHLQFSGGAETVFYDPSLEIIWDIPEITGTGPYEALGYVDSVFDRFGVENLNPISQRIHVYDREELYLFVDDTMPFYNAECGRLSLRCLSGDPVSGTVTAWISQDGGETFAPAVLLFSENIHEGPDFFVELAELFLDPDKTYQIYIQLQAESGVMESNLLHMNVENNEWIIAFGGDRNCTGRNPDTIPPDREELEPSLPEKEDEQEGRPELDQWPNEAEHIEENEKTPSDPDDAENEEHTEATMFGDDDVADIPDIEVPSSQLPAGHSASDESIDEQVRISSDNHTSEPPARDADIPSKPVMTESSDPSDETVQADKGQQSFPTEAAVPQALDAMPHQNGMGDAAKESEPAEPYLLSNTGEATFSNQADNSVALIKYSLFGIILFAIGGITLTGLRRRVK